MRGWRVTPVGWIVLALFAAALVLIVVGSHGVRNVAFAVAAVLGLILGASGVSGRGKSLQERQADFRGETPDSRRL